MSHHTTSSFGRGWIPGDRDIGLPGEEHLASPLPPAGGPEDHHYAGGFEGSAAYADAHPNPSRVREALCMAQPFTPERRVRFLHILATAGNVRRACHMVGVSPQSAYVHKRRDAAFAAGWDAALILARDAAEEVLAERALQGTHETIFYRGEAVGSRTRFDARLLLAHLARLDAHAARTEAERAPAPGIAARFDDYLAELLDAAETGWDPVFEPPIDEFDMPPQWAPATPTRAEALRAAREDVLHDFPASVEDLPPEALADLDLAETDPEDVLDAALAEAQSAAETAAAEAWDDEAEARLAALDVLFADMPPEDPLHFSLSLSKGQMAKAADDPLHFSLSLSKGQMGRGTAREAGGGGVIPAEPPYEVKSRPWFPLNRVNPVNRAVFRPPSAAHRAGAACR